MADTLTALFREYAKQNPDRIVLMVKDPDGNYENIRWETLYSLSQNFGAGLQSIGVKKDDHIGIISENRKEWLIADLAILSIGAADVPRGSDSMANEIRYILSHGDCVCSLVEDAVQLEKVLSIKKDLSGLKTLIVMDQQFQKKDDKIQGANILTFQEVINLGTEYLAAHPKSFEEAIDRSQPEDLATIIYTSGTTGEPKGVMLTHSNFLHQIRAPHTPLDIRIGDVFLTALPVWHSYERALEYVAIFGGCILAYSKLVTQILMDDMQKARPMIFPSVPRIWERLKEGINRTVESGSPVKRALFHFFLSVGTAYAGLRALLLGLKPQFRRRYRFLEILAGFLPFILILPLNLLGQVLVFGKLKKRLGGRFRFGVSGGGALPPHVDKYFAAAGILLLEGYGLTESSPIVSARNSRRPVSGTIGPPMPEVEVKVLDENGNTLPPGQKGVLYVKGPNVMKGYYKKPEATKEAITEDGWLNTGDLAMLTLKGEISILGREKETIVLLGGENIEPSPIEDAINESVYIDQAMVVGQDQKYLGCLVVPNLDTVKAYADENGIPYGDPKDLLDNESIYALFSDEINSRINLKRGFKLFERINRLAFIAKPFEPGIEMTHSLKLKRNVIGEIYKDQISQLFTSRK